MNRFITYVMYFSMFCMLFVSTVILLFYFVNVYKFDAKNKIDYIVSMNSSLYS